MQIFFAFPSCLFGIILAYDNKTALLSYLCELKTRMVSKRFRPYNGDRNPHRKICRMKRGWNYGIPSPADNPKNRNGFFKGLSAKLECCCVLYASKRRVAQQEIYRPPRVPNGGIDDVGFDAICND
jgi:hypothetical protein